MKKKVRKMYIIHARECPSCGCPVYGDVCRNCGYDFDQLWDYDTGNMKKEVYEDEKQ